MFPRAVFFPETSHISITRLRAIARASSLSSSFSHISLYSPGARLRENSKGAMTLLPRGVEKEEEEEGRGGGGGGGGRGEGKDRVPRYARRALSLSGHV